MASLSSTVNSSSKTRTGQQKKSSNTNTNVLSAMGGSSSKNTSRNVISCTKALPDLPVSLPVQPSTLHEEIVCEDSESRESLHLKSTVPPPLKQEQMSQATEKNECVELTQRLGSRKIKNNNKKDLEKQSSSGSSSLTTCDMSVEKRAVSYDQRKKTFENFVAQLKHKGLYSLSGEIDRCFRKVSEGLETVEDIWHKIYNARNTNQKEKYEADLKKEIRKLKRLRDQLKSWIASGEIKEKSTLVEARKLIETQMERFKTLERETKIKAYSKEGLVAPEKLDPTTREREDLNNWLVTAIDQMQIQMDQFESEIESLMAGKKKRFDKEKQDRLDELKVFMERHKFHMSKLETLMRMLDNLSVDVNMLREFLDQVKKIKDDIEYYLESSQDAEFEENEFLYDDIVGLEEQQALGNLALTGSDSELGMKPTLVVFGNYASVFHIHTSGSSSDPEKRRESSNDSMNKVVRPVDLKPNHSPSPAGNGTGLGVVTPPLNVKTLNSSLPSSGMSNCVSSFSSLSSSPIKTQNYEHTLRNVKSLSHLEDRKHNSSSTLLSNSNATLLSESAPSSLIYNSSSKISTSNYDSLVNNSSPSSTFSYSGDVALGEIGTTTTISTVSSPAVITATFNELTGSSDESSSNSENSEETLTILASPTLTPTPHPDSSTTPTAQSSPLKNHVNVITNSSSFHYGEVSENGLKSNSPEVQLMSSPSDSSFILPSTSDIKRAGLEDSLPLSSSLSMSVKSAASAAPVNHSRSVVTSNQFGGCSSSTKAIRSGDINVTSISASAKNGNTSSSSTNGPAGGQLFGFGSSPSSLSSQNINNACASNSNMNVTLSHLKQREPFVQQSNSRDMTPPSAMDFMIKPTEQIRIGQYLNEPGDTMTFKSIAQDVIDRTGIQISDSGLLERGKMEAYIPPILGVSPLGQVPLQKEHHHQLQMLEAAHLNLPISADSERMRELLPRTPLPTPSYYPQLPLKNSDTMMFFRRMSVETLFFMFYYLEGTKAQYMAAKVLKSQSWRFHTKYMMWFQRHEHPKVINEDYEQHLISKIKYVIKIVPQGCTVELSLGENGNVYSSIRVKAIFMSVVTPICATGAPEIITSLCRYDEPTSLSWSDPEQYMVEHPFN